MSLSYSYSGVYEGEGRIFSRVLSAYIEGFCKATWDADGTFGVEMHPGNLDDFPSLMNCIGEFDGFSELIIDDKDGVLTAERCYLADSRYECGDSGLQVTLNFRILAAEYLPHNRSNAQLWNASLLNFVADLKALPHNIPHPLWVEDPKTTAEGVRRGLVFKFGGALALVEHLPGYEAACHLLQQRETQAKVTSMASGSIPSDVGIDVSSVKEWFPVDMASTMSMATGSPVSIGIVELRSDQGGLSKRLHFAFVKKPFRSGHMFISEPVHGNSVDSGISALVELTVNASEEKLRVVRRLFQTIEAAQAAMGFPDHAYSYVVRALDGRANDLRLNKQSLTATLNSNMAAEVTGILIEARDKIRVIETNCRGGGQSATADVLRRIASRAEAADSLDNSFGISLGRVLKHYGLNDETAINDLYREAPRSDGLSWSSALNKYRGGVIHEGFLNYDEDANIRDVFHYSRHLIDVCARICLKELNYQGMYNPFNLSALQSVDADWVQTPQHVKQFGFAGNSPELFRFVKVGETPHSHPNSLASE